MVKLQAKTLFKFQWQIEKLCPEIGFVSISPLTNMKNGIDQAAKSYHVVKHKKDTKTLRTGKEWNL